jgi:hypothetical protein
MKNLKKIQGASIALILLAVSGASWGGTFIDPNFFVCSGTTADACGGDPNPISSSGFNVFTNATGTSGPLNPFLIVVAVPNLPGVTVPVIDSSSSLTVSIVGTSPLYGGFQTSSSGLIAGSFDSNSKDSVNIHQPADLFGFAGLYPSNNSMSFTNLSTKDLTLGLNPASFFVYEFAVTVIGTSTGQNLGNNSVFSFTSNLALGSFVGAWGIECYTSPDICQNGTNVYDSAFTVAGWVNNLQPPPPPDPTPTPEPTTVWMLGLGLLGLFGYKYRQSRLAA